MQKVILNKRYIVAVSGGVDSMSLLDYLVKSNINNLDNIIIAHFDHGIRKDSKKDRILVQNVSKKNGLKFYYLEGNLGSNTSEKTAREERYRFLNQVKKDTSSFGLITAHHYDDLIETTVLNLLRGTNRRGLASLNSSKRVLRPFLNLSKAEIIQYALTNNLNWNEDYTNELSFYHRNYLRNVIIPKLSSKQKEELINIIQTMKEINSKMDSILNHLYKKKVSNNSLSRLWFNSQDYEVQIEFVAFWLRKNKFLDYSRKSLIKIVNDLKTYPKGAIIEVSKQYFFKVGKDLLFLSYNN